MPAGPAGRVVCSRCGANNFDTQAACWKCGAPLTGGAPAPSAPAYNQSPGPAMPGAPLPQAVPFSYAPTVDPAIAVWSGVLLAFFFPLFAIPVGMVFLMTDDRRKCEIGRITLIWGLVFGLFQTIGSLMLIKEPIQMAIGMAQSVGARTGHGGAGDTSGFGPGGLRQEVEPLPDFPH